MNVLTRISSLENTLSRSPRLVDLVLKKRSREDCNSLLIKIGIDESGGFLKFCMSIFDINNFVSKNESGLSKKLKDSGVKKTFLCARELRERQKTLGQFRVAKARLQIHNCSRPQAL